MIGSPSILLVLALTGAVQDAPTPVPATTPAPAAAPTQPGPEFFVVEFKVGPRWDAAKPPNEQAHFAEHSANLTRLRKEGKILIGGRYTDKGFLLVTASSEEEVRRYFDPDPSIVNQVFFMYVHEFRPFYTGCVGTKGAMTGQ